jgi:hypothetical protein
MVWLLIADRVSGWQDAGKGSADARSCERRQDFCGHVKNDDKGRIGPRQLSANVPETVFEPKYSNLDGEFRTEPSFVTLPAAEYLRGQHENRLRVTDGRSFDREMKYRLLGPPL